MRYHLHDEDMTEQERARRFRYFTREQLERWARAAGPPYACTDPAALRAGARIMAAEDRRIEAEAGAAGQDPPPAA